MCYDRLNGKKFAHRTKRRIKALASNGSVAGTATSGTQVKLTEDEDGTEHEPERVGIVRHIPNSRRGRSHGAMRTGSSRQTVWRKLECDKWGWGREGKRSDRGW